MSREDLLAIALCLGLSGVAAGKTPVRKSPSRVVLDYRRQTGAERCPTKPELEAEVRKILGRSAFTGKAPRTVRCVLRGEGAGLAARVQLVDARSGRVLGVREISGTGPGCEELGASVAFAIALAIDPLARPPRAAGATVGATSAVARPPAAPLPPAATSAGPGVSNAAGSAGSAMGAGAMGVSGAPRTVPPTRGGLATDAGRLSPVALAPLALARPPDAGPPPPPTDAGVTVPDAGTRPPDAGAPVVDAGTPMIDAGGGAPDAGLSTADAGVPAASALQLDGGTEVIATEAGTPVLVREAPEPKMGWRPVVGVEALGAAGVLPGFAGGVLVHAGAATSTASVEIEGRWLPGTARAFGTGSVSTSLVAGSVVGCARFGSWSACGLALAGPVSAKGSGFARSQDASAWMFSAGASGRWEWLFADPVGLRLHLDGAVNLVRPRFLVDSQEAWAVPPVSVWVGGGLFGRF